MELWDQTFGAEREYIHHELSALEALRNAEKAFAALQEAAVWK